MSPFSGDQKEVRVAATLHWGHPLYLYPQKSKSIQLNYYFCDICNFYVIIPLYVPPLGSKFQEDSTGLKARVLISFLSPSSIW